MTTLRPPAVIETADLDRDFAGILAVYRANGWSHAERPDLLRIAIDRADLALVARAGEEVVAFARTMSDGAFAVYIADILVLPDLHRQGIGSQLLGSLLEYYPMGTFHHQVLVAERGAEAFYKSAGLVPVSTFGLTAFIRTRG